MGSEQNKKLDEKIAKVKECIHEFSDQYLNSSFEDRCLELLEELKATNPYAMLKGREKTWACGIAHTVGMMNQLFEPHAPHYMSNKEFFEGFGVSSSGGGNKSREVRDILGINLERSWISDESMLNLELLNQFQQFEGMKEELLELIGFPNVFDMPAYDGEIALSPADQKRLDDAYNYLEDHMERLTNDQQRIKVAKHALDISPYCTGAYNLWAIAVPSERERIRIVKMAVEKEAEMLGKENIERYAGELWMWYKARNYLTMKFDLATILKYDGQLTVAIDELKDILALNENDNQGVRYYLIHWLVEANRLDEAQQICEQCEDDASTAIAFAKVLLLYKQGKEKAAEQQLNIAQQQNPHIVQYILGQKVPPEELPEFFSPGSEEEAIDYFFLNIESWVNTGATRWVQELLSGGRKSRKKATGKGKIIQFPR